MKTVLEIIRENPDIEIIDIPLHTPEWYDFRLNGIGASEIGYVLRKSDWKDSLPVFEEKVGLKNLAFSLNEHMTFGSYLEKSIADVWTYYDGEEYYENINAGKRIRSCETEQIKNRYFRNKKYPWLFCSLDGIMPPGTPTTDGRVLDKLGVLEIKNQRSFVLKKWDIGVPPEQLYQLHQIMLILEADYGEIATLVDGCHLQVTPVDLVPELANDLIEESRKFWYNQVLPAKETKKLLDKAYFQNEYQLATELEAELFGFQPEPIGTPAYIQYLAESAREEPSPITADSEIYKHAMHMKRIDAVKKQLDKKKNVHEAFIRHHFLRYDGTEMEFGDMGFVRLKKRKGSDRATLYNYVKDERSNTQIEQEAFLEVEKMDVV